MPFKEAALKSAKVLFAKFGKAATVIFSDDTILETTVIHRFPDKIADVFDSRVHSQTDVFEFLISELPTGKAIKQISVEGKNYTPQGTPINDQYGIITKVDACEI